MFGRVKIIILPLRMDISTYISVGIKIGRRLDHKILVAAFTIVQTAPDHASINAAYIAHDLVISVNATFVCV